MQDRRNFLKKFTLLSTAACAPTFLVRSVKAAMASGMTQLEMGNPNRILVVVELAGGCDGLNTVIPYTNDIYYGSRPTLAINSNQMHILNDTHALHPAMTGFSDLWGEGRLGIVHGVGYPNPNRSHFRSMDIWQTAEPDSAATEGWIASYFNAQPDPDGSLQGLNIGGRVPRAMISSEGAAPSIQNIDTYRLQTDPVHPGDEANKNAAFQAILSEPHNQYRFQDYVSQTILDATVSSVQLLEGQENYSSTVEYPTSSFGNNLRTIAQIIAADLGISVFYTSINGFDTHANQIVGGNNVAGIHASLLDDVSQTLRAFHADMQEMGRGPDVLIMTFSEFGRRLNENGSLGTDHGTANQMFLIGDPVQGGIYGSQPSLQSLDPIGDMIFTADFRSVYASVLANWLGADHQQVLGGNWLDPSLSFV